MKRSATFLLTVFCVSVLVTACAGMSSTVPQETVHSWRQRPDERGTLAVGVVASVERIHFQREAEPPRPPGVPAAAPLPPVVLAIEAVRNADWLYRTTITMKDGSTRILDLNYIFEPKACVAFRPGLSADDTLVIEALPGECN